MLNANEAELPALIASIIANPEPRKEEAFLIKPTSVVYIGPVTLLKKDVLKTFELIVCCRAIDLEQFPVDQRRSFFVLPCHDDGKLGSRDLRKYLPGLEQYLRAQISTGKRVLFACSTGQNLSVGVALVALCLFFDDYGMVRILSEKERTSVSKLFIRKRLAWITQSMIETNLSRATLQAVHHFLMSLQ